ncbi:TetR/AcrR family transcriptional regulator [Streptomyces sp. HNM0575]|uniref:QsdR family transcriptional regulator n=1 Tax=Streptomyces sp. HNM0575 TaxID=2716338 RepID=UPI00145E85BA|nr:QsdR family transcriptional regulator [Streptomyces sp. HNM0575]NLU74020.1 TetR/AcrR family transcriptional regulator [Streptomyces sp. HNM0575]
MAPAPKRENRENAAGCANSDADVRVVVPEGVAAPSGIPADVFAATVSAYAAGRRLDMQSLARRLGIGRATLYRQVGSRERLLDEVVWWRSRHALVDAVRLSSGQRGADRITAVVSHVLSMAEKDRALHAYLENDPRAALRILTGVQSKSQRCMVGAVERLLELERDRGHLPLDDIPAAAYAIVRISETFLYSDVIADRAPDVAAAVRMIRAMLVGLGSADAPPARGH